MAKNPEAVEAKMVVLGCTGRRVTMDLIKSHIDSVEYETVTINGQMMMFCGIKMDNGFVAVGKPATCIDPANWREEIGQEVSYDNSFEELWKLEAYRQMSEKAEPAQNACKPIFEDKSEADAPGCGHEYSTGFGSMLSMLRDGKHAARSGWNGKGIRLMLVNPPQSAVPSDACYDVSIGDAYTLDPEIKLMPWIAILNPDGRMCPWFPSQTDMLADDWHVAE